MNVAGARARIDGAVAPQQGKRSGKTLLVFTQVFVPDPASVGQHMTDVAVEMARRGHRVVVFTSSRGYDDPSIEYPARERLHGVEIVRLGGTSFGKTSIAARVAGTASFTAQCTMRAFLSRGADGILYSTTPPLIGASCSLVGSLRRIPLAYWAMDLNPDQLIALGKISARGVPARLLEGANRFLLERSSLVVALDRFMAERLSARVSLDDKLLVLPPWPHEDHLDPVEHEANPFRERHGLAGKFVVMYSGNHSPSNPLRTILEAAARLREDDRVRFVFVGGGLGKKEVEAFAAKHALANVMSLPYQPLSELRYSLSAADVHLVSLGPEMVGIIHPCKIYGAMAIGRPILYLGPPRSHVGDLLAQHPIGWSIAHGEVERAVEVIETARAMPRSDLARMGAVERTVLAESLSQQVLCTRFCDALERSLHF
jgi:colanic acid biosynthesis glycosyl transferase WcaI